MGFCKSEFISTDIKKS